MPETVSDILGKGFKFEQRVRIETITETLSGTMAAFVGGANWGPVGGAPTLILNSFESYFGTPIDADDLADSSGLGAKYHLTFSPFCRFIRVGDGTETKAIKSIVKPAQAAKISGDIDLRGSSFVVEAGVNDKLQFHINGSATPADQLIVTLAPTPAATPFISDALTYNVVPPDNGGNYTPGVDYFDFYVDSFHVQYVVETGDAFTTLCDSGHVSNYAVLWKAAMDTVLTAQGVPTSTFTVVSTNKIQINSGEHGAASLIRIINIPKVFPTATSDNPLLSVAVNTSIESIIAEIVAADVAKFTAARCAWSLNALTGFFEASTVAMGATKSIKVDTQATNFYTSLGIIGLVGTTATGADIDAYGGTFSAAYPGKDGNSIIISVESTQDGQYLTIFFRGSVVQKFFNFSYVVADANYIGNLFALDANVAKVVEFITPIGATSIPPFVTGDMTLAGGTSGTKTGTTPIPDTKYISALEEYKNVDLYNIDILCVCGNVSQTVADKVEDVCSFRQDCFGVVDPPEDVAGYPTGNIYSMIAWHNGTGGGRNKKLTSWYIATYFPWVMIQVAGNTLNPKQWHAPSVRVIGSIAQCDKLVGNQFAAPAGPRTSITDIEDIAVKLRDDDKVRLYADELGNNVNPIVYTSARGYFIDGQKTTERTAGNPLSRIATTRTALYLKKTIYAMAPDYFWMPLTKATQDDLLSRLTAIMKGLVQANAVKENYTIVCDATVNTAAVDAQRGLIATIEWEGVQSIEKIKIVSTVVGKTVNVVFGNA